MSVKSGKTQIKRSALTKARLFVGNGDPEQAAFTTNIGEAAVISIADHEKPGPNEDSAAVIPVNDQYLVLIVADGVAARPARAKPRT